MKINKLLLLLFTITTCAAQAQTYNKAFKTAQAYAVVATADGGAIAVGEATNFEKNGFIRKVNAKGDSVWLQITHTAIGKKTVAEELYAISRLHNSTYIIAGALGDSITRLGQASAIWLDTSGNILKVRRYAADTTKNIIYGYAVKERKNGNIALAGYIYTEDLKNDSTLDINAYLAGLNSAGDTLWTKQMGTAYYDYINSMDIAADGGYILGGYSYPYGNTAQATAYLIKTDSLGNLAWQQTYDDLGYGSSAGAVIATQGGDYYFAGASTTDAQGDDDGYLVKVNNAGQVLWKQRYPGVSIGAYFNAIKQLPNGDLVVCGGQALDNQNKRYAGWLLKLNATNGDIIWQHQYSYLAQDSVQNYFYGMDVTTSGGFVMCGLIEDYRKHKITAAQTWLLQTDSLGNVTSNGIQQNGKLIPFATLALSPNPATTNSILSYQFAAPTAANLTVSDINGKVLKTYTLPTTDKGQITLDATQYPQGMYFCKLMVQGQPQQVMKWMVAK